MKLFRICMIDTFRRHHPSMGGHAIRILGLANWLSSAGHSVLIVRPGIDRGVEFNSPVLVYSLGLQQSVTRMLGVLQRFLFQSRTHFEDSVQMNLPISLLKTWGHILSSDLVQVEDPTLVGAVILARLCRKPCVFDGEGISSQVFRESFLKRKNRASKGILSYAVAIAVEKVAYHLSTKVITSSQDDKDYLVKLHGLSPNKIHVISNPVDSRVRPQIGPPSPTLMPNVSRISDDERIAIFVGDLRSPHNKEAVDYIARVLSSNEQVRSSKIQFLIVGRHDILGEELVIPGLVFLGPVEDVTPYIQLADVCIAPLLSQPTGIKTKVITYLACGKPTIATRTATTGIDASIRKYIDECDLEEFPRVLLSRLANTQKSAPPDLRVSNRVLSIYGQDSVGLKYEHEILRQLLAL